MLHSSFQKQPHFSALGEKGGVDAPQREEKCRGEKGESKNSRDGAIGVGGGALKRESRRARAAEAEALFVEN